jgi:hypothetical protein
MLKSSDLIDDPDGSFHEVMYSIHMGGATPPPEPGAERLIVAMRPDKVYVASPGQVSLRLSVRAKGLPCATLGPPRVRPDPRTDRPAAARPPNWAIIGTCADTS